MKWNDRLPVFVLFFSLLLMLSESCRPDKGKNIPDVSDIQIELKISRFEKDLLAQDTSDIDLTLERLDAEYPVFFKEVFLGKMIPALQDPEIFAMFIRNDGIRHLLDTCGVVFGDFSPEEKQFKEAFRFYKHFFPADSIPEIVTYASEYSLGNFTLDDEMLGIGLDFFFGENYRGYNPEFFPRYICRTMNRQHLVAKSMLALVKNKVGDPAGDRLLDLMINNGKSLFILDHLLPYAPDSIKLEYTAAQTQWCDNNEQQIWAHFLKEDLLYSTRMKDIRKLVDFSPNSPGMPQEAPGRTANWLGWQIVKSFMKRHPETTFDQLIAIEDAQDLLTKSKYKPQR